MRVVIADDNLLMREGIAALLRRAGIEVVAEAGDADELLRRGRRARARRRDRRHPDAADPHRRGPARRARDPRPPPADGHRDPVAARRDRHGAADPRRAPRAASATCSRTASADVEDFVDTLRRVAAGGCALDPQVVARLLASAARRRPRWPSLTRARARGARARRRGPLEPGVGERLGVSERAVQKHVTAIFDQARPARRTRTTTAASSPCWSTWPTPDAALAAGGAFRHPATPADRLIRASDAAGTVVVPHARTLHAPPESLPTPRRGRGQRPRPGPPLRRRRHRRRCPPRRVGRHRPRPPDRRHGPVGLRQVDAHAHPRRPRQAHRRAR